MKYNYSGSCTALGMRAPGEGVSSQMGDRKNVNGQSVGRLKLMEKYRCVHW